MEDRYLFKAKRIDNGEWVQGALFNGESHCIIGQEIKFSPYTEHECKIVGHEVDRDTICQCTGLKDKNGKLIFENDIVKHDFGEYQIGVQLAIVKYDSKYACYQIKPIFDWMYCDKSDCEVVGNKFDNPELLEREG